MSVSSDIAAKYLKLFNPKKIIDNPSDQQLRDWALEQGGVITEFGNLSVITKVRSRIAKFTEVVTDDIKPEDDKLLCDALAHLNKKEVIQLDRVMCQNPKYQRNCRVYIDADYARLPLMWGNTLFPTQGGEPDFITITVADWPEKRTIVFPESGLTITMGTDTTLSCHSHWLRPPERVIIRKDDVCILRPDGTAIGTEESFYLKTDGMEPDAQPLLYAAVISPRAILENVCVDPAMGKIDFFDSSLTSNGRAVVKRGDIAYTDDTIDLGKVNYMIFITRRNDVVPPVMRLSPEWAAAAFMLGESIETSAGDPTKVGQSLRVVGTNPFIVGSEEEEGNMFLDLLRRNPDIQCFIMNTGKVGGEDGQKITVKDSVKILEMIARDQIKWQTDDFWGYEVPAEIPGINMKRFDLSQYYSPDQIQALRDKLKQERLEWLSQFKALDKDVIQAIKP